MNYKCKMPPTLIGTAATFLALHCIRGHLAFWSDIYTKVSSQLPILMLTQYQYNSEGRSALRVGQASVLLEGGN